MRLRLSRRANSSRLPSTSRVRQPLIIKWLDARAAPTAAELEDMVKGSPSLQGTCNNEVLMVTTGTREKLSFGAQATLHSS
jgi:hypothetical protein